MISKRVFSRWLSHPGRTKRLVPRRFLVGVAISAATVGATAWGVQAAMATSTGPTAGQSVPSSTVSQLAQLASNFAFSVSHTSAQSAVAGVMTYSRAVGGVTPGDTVVGAGSKPVYVIVMQGSFEGYAAKVPPGAQMPSGSALALIVDPSSMYVTDWSIGNQPVSANLASQVGVTSLPLVAHNN